jgi:uncharacterized membrane protein
LARKPGPPAKSGQKPPATPGGELTVPKQPEQAELRERIEREIGPLVSGSQREIIVERMQQIVVSEYFSGPIAHPRHLREYEEIEPGSADRIIRMAERQQDHAIEMGRQAMKAGVDDRKLGMWLGFASLVLLLVLATVFGAYGNTAMAGLFLGAAALGVVGAFIKGRMEG